MLPLLVSGLLQQGLGMLGQAVLAKGQEVVEDKLGISLEKSMQTEEGIQLLRNLEIKHKEFLVEAALTQMRLQMDNVSDARKRDAIVVTKQGRNYRADLMYLMAVLMILSIVYLIWKTPEINEYTKGIMTLILGRFLGYLDNIYNFEFGSTRSSKVKDSTIESLSKEK